MRPTGQKGKPVQDGPAWRAIPKMRCVSKLRRSRDGYDGAMSKNALKSAAIAVAVLALWAILMFHDFT
jgi:hypothetical protein